MEGEIIFIKLIVKHQNSKNANFCIVFVEVYLKWLQVTEDIRQEVAWTFHGWLQEEEEEGRDGGRRGVDVEEEEVGKRLHTVGAEAETLLRSRFDEN